MEAEACLKKAYQLAPGEDYVLRHLQIVQNRIAKSKLNLSGIQEADYGVQEESKVVSNKSIDETERKTEPVVSDDKEQQRYSSRVVNTEPLFIKNVDNIDYADGTYADELEIKEQNVSNFENRRRGATDKDNLSSGMS